jgi:hypothetical protein
MNHDLEVALNDRDITNIFSKLFDKLDKQSIEERVNAIYIPINDNTFPELFRGDEVQEKYIEILIQEDIFTLIMSKKNRFRPWTEKKSKLQFNPQKEIFLREHYHRGIKNNLWEDAIANCGFVFEKRLKEILLKTPIRIKDKSDNEVIRRFIDWSIQSPIKGSAREESARCFWGISKVFDKREDLCTYFNLTLLPITLLMHACSHTINNVLFIENLETFYQATRSTNNVFNEILIVYASGYKASAKRVRREGGSSVFFTENCLLSKGNQKNILDWLYLRNQIKIEVFFWGDLDYEGMAILDALREQFKNIKVWDTGYQPMIKAIENNFGHCPSMAGKENQREVRITSKEDNLERSIKVLLLSKNTFIDQEFVDIESL